MIKENRHIVVLLVLFLAVISGFEAINLWDKLSMEQPSGIMYQGCLFFVFYYVLKTYLFAPYIAIFQEREKATVGKQASIESLKSESDALLLKYEESLQAAREKATQIKDGFLVEGETFEKSTVMQAKQEASKSLAEEKAKVNSMVVKAKKQLQQDVPKIAEDIVARFIRVEKPGGVLKKPMRKAVS